MMVARPSIVVYSFAPKETPSYPNLNAEAHDYLRSLWAVCTRLGMTEPVEELNLPVEFPAEISFNGPHFQLRAAKIDTKRHDMDYQAFLFEYQDVFGFVATLESNEEHSQFVRWQELLEEWNSCLGNCDLPRGMIGEAYLFTGLCENDAFSPSSLWLSDEHFSSQFAPQFGKDVINALPGSAYAKWRAGTFYLTENEYCIWEGEHIGSRRAIALVTPQAKRDAMFRWTVWGGQHQLSPFARYLLHSSKLRFAQQVFEREIITLRKQSVPLDRILEGILSKQTENIGLWGPDEIIKVQSELSREQARSYGLLYGISKLKELRLTTQIAERNMRRLIPATYPGSSQTHHSIFGQDIARAEWLREQVEIDSGYLEAVRERAEEGYKMTTILLEREGQKTARRLNSLVLLQGTLLGSITVGLLMLPAFDVHEKMSSPLIWSVVGLLMALALALPPLFARWHETYQPIDRIVGGALSAALVWFGVTVWEVSELPSIHVAHQPWIIYRASVLFFGFLLGYWSINRLERFKARIRKLVTMTKDQKTAP